MNYVYLNLNSFIFNRRLYIFILAQSIPEVFLQHRKVYIF